MVKVGSRCFVQEFPGFMGTLICAASDLGYRKVAILVSSTKRWHKRNKLEWEDLI